MEYAPLTEKHEEIAKAIVNAAYAVHKALGPGLLESIYEPCYCHELHKQGWRIQQQVIIPIVYDGITFGEGFRLDVIVEDLVICELKAVDRILAVHEAQLLSYMKLTGKRLGFLINFNVPLIRNGIKRFVR
ncbi:MAG: GxxExxY protein [Chloroflexi bacterium]|nr:GxxExxY protein [Chloroflexota bacterium]